MRTRARSRSTIGRLAVLVVLLAVAIPVGAVLLRSVRVDGDWTTEALTRVLTSARTWRVVAITVGQAAVSCLLTVVVGVPAAWVLARYRFPGRGVVRTVAMVPFVLPTVVIGAAFASILGPSGLVDVRGSWWPILAAHLCFNLAVMIRVVGSALADLDPDLEDAARTLGASPFGAARRVLIPAVGPSVAAAAVVVFLFCLTSFGVIVILGGGAVTTIEVEIWVRATQQFDLSGAAVLAGLQVMAVVATLALYSRLSRRAHRPGRTTAPTGRTPRGVAEWGTVGAAVGVVAVVSVVPLAALFERSLRIPGGHGLTNWTQLGSATQGTGLAVSPVDAVMVSVVTATVAALLAVIVAVPASRVAARRPGGAADRILLLPLGVSATTVGLGLLLAAGRPPVDLRRSWWLVPDRPGAGRGAAGGTGGGAGASRPAVVGAGRGRRAGGGPALALVAGRAAHDPWGGRGRSRPGAGGVPGRVRSHRVPGPGGSTDRPGGGGAPDVPTRSVRIRPGHGHELCAGGAVRTRPGRRRPLRWRTTRRWRPPGPLNHPGSGRQGHHV